MLKATTARFTVTALLAALASTVAGCQNSSGGNEEQPRANALRSGPTVEVEESSHDFGRVAEGDKLRHVFKVTNIGDAPLVIDKVRTSCGCTAAVLKEESVSPGESTEIEVTFNTSNRKGKQTKKITIKTNDATTPQTVVEIQAEVVARLAFEPEHVHLETKYGEKISQDVWLTGTLAPTAKPKIEDVTGDGVVSAELVEEQVGDGSKRGVRVAMMVKKVTRGRGVIHVSTGLKEKPKLQLRYSYESKGNLTAPPSLFIDPQGSSLRERTFVVKSTEEGFVLQAAKVEKGPFKAEITKKGKDFEVRVSATGAPDDQSVTSGHLVLVSNDPLEPRKEVRLTMGRRRGAVRSTHRTK